MGTKLNLLASTAMASCVVVWLDPAMAGNVPSPFSWTGCYVGLNAGGLSARIAHNVVVPAVAGGPGELDIGDSGSGTGFIGGGQAGCNQQYFGNWVFGIEGDLDYARTSHNFNSNFDASPYNLGFEDAYGPATISAQASLHWLATFRGRVGYSVWDRTFIFATGGIAIGSVSASLDGSVSSTLGPFLFAGSYSGVRTGWVLGAGVEHAFTDSITAKLEYLHFDLGDVSYVVIGSNGGGTLPTTWNANASFSGDLVRVGLNFKIP